jgi:Nucleotidyltransferase domain
VSRAKRPASALQGDIQGHPNQSALSHTAATLTAMGITFDKDLIVEASRRLAVAAPDAKVILFGSHARGEARSDSDLELVSSSPRSKVGARSS